MDNELKQAMWEKVRMYNTLANKYIEIARDITEVLVALEAKEGGDDEE